MLGPGNTAAAESALKEWPQGLQVGGGVNGGNAAEWIEKGAGKVIVTSYLFPGGKFSQERLDEVLAALRGDVERLVIDLSCRRKEGGWWVAMNKWQDLTDMEVTEGRHLLPSFSPFPVLLGFPPGCPCKILSRMRRLWHG